MPRGGWKSAKFHSPCHESEAAAGHEPVPKLGAGAAAARTAGGALGQHRRFQGYRQGDHGLGGGLRIRVFTYPLGFSTMLALSHRPGPSVLQIRSGNILPEHLEDLVIAALIQHEADLSAGALVVVDKSRIRVRVLPI